MTTFELKRSILQDINALMDDEAAMRRISPVSYTHLTLPTKA